MKASGRRPLVHDTDLHIVMPRALYDKLKAAGEKQFRSVPNLVRVILEDAMAEPQDQSLRDHRPGNLKARIREAIKK